MNSPRPEAYKILIDRLLTCVSSEEPEILRTNRDLIDAALVQTMLKTAADLTKGGDPARANRLMNIAGSLLGVCSNSSTQVTPQEYFDFLMQLLGTIHDSKGNWLKVDSLLRSNLNLLDQNLARELRSFATDSLSELEPYLAQTLALDIYDLSQVMLEFPLGNRGHNLEIAITGYEIFASVFTQQNFPEIWADSQNSLGNIYRSRSSIKAENLPQAIHHYKAALQVRTPKAFPISHIETQYLLGLTYRDAGQLLDAFSAIELAIDTLESLRSEIASGRAEYNNIYAWMVQVCLELGKQQPEYYNRALEFVERSKASHLVELLVGKNLYPKRNCYTNQNQYQKTCYLLDQLRRQIPAKQRQLEACGDWQSQIENRSTKLIIQQELNYLQQQWHNLLQEINGLDPRFKSIQQVEPISFSNIQAIADPGTAMIQWYIADDKIVTFALSAPSPHPKVWQSSSQDLKTLRDLASYKQTDELAQLVRQLAQILQIDEILAQIPSGCDRLILIPHRYLHLLPLHALPLKGQPNKCLLDRFPRGVGYAPSCQLLQLSQNQQRYSFSHLFAVQDPTNDLVYTNLEVATICSFFASAEVLIKQDADAAASKVDGNLLEAHCIHFCCQGEFNSNSPLDSALILAQSQFSEDIRLTLAEIFRFNLERCRLVTLSAWETGTIDPNRNDEYIGWPSSFLYAGSPSVVSSLWRVDDLATTLLLSRFYESIRKHHLLEGGDIAIALKDAQTWLRDLTSSECEIVLNQLKPKIDQILARTPKKERKLVAMAIEDAMKKVRLRRPYPFANPYYWAGFTATGF
jgi:CHAT domain-containing protein